MKQMKRKLAVFLAFAIAISGISIRVNRAEAENAMTVYGKGVAAEKTAGSGNTVWFGNYYQDKVTDSNYISRFSKAKFTNDRTTINGVEIARRNGNYYYSSPIEWIVLADEGDSYLLLSKRVLEKRSLAQYWHESDMRTWLNDEFYHLAFTETEKQNIVVSDITTIWDDYYDVYVNHVDPERSTVTQDNVFLLTKYDALNENYGWSNSEDADESRIAYCSQYVDDNESACTWFVREPFWFYGNMRDRFVTKTGSVVKGGMRDTGSYGVRPAIRVKKSSVSETKPEVNYDFPLEDYDAEKAAIDAMPDMANLGEDTIKGPEITVAGKSFNLWSSKANFSIGIKDVLTAKYNAKEQTVDLLIGLGPLTSKEIKSPNPNSDEYDSKWKDTYKEIKTMVNACGKDTSTATWNKFQKTRKKLKEIDAKAVYSAKGSVAGYVKFKLNDGKIADILESGMIANLKVGASVKTPLFYVVYSEFGIAGKAEGKVYVDYMKSYQLKGSVKLTFEPSIAIGADVVVADVKGGLKGDIDGKISFLPWESFKKSVNVSITGSLFFSMDTFIPGIKGEEKSWKFQTLELYPELGKVTDGDINIGYKGIKSASPKASKKALLSSDHVLSKDMSSVVYENAKPQMIEMDDGKYLVTYLDEVNVDGEYQVKAMYRIGDGNVWSDPIEVNSETVLNTAVKIAKSNGKYYFMYEGSTKKIDETMENSEIAGSLKLYVSTMENGVVTKNEILSEEGEFKYDYDLVVNNDTITAIWAENSENDILLESGGTEVYSSVLEENEKWSEKKKMFSVNDPIEGFSAGVFDNNVSVAYIYNDRLYVNGNKKTTGISSANFDSPKIYDGKIYLRSEGLLYLFDGKTSISTNVYCGVNYMVRGTDVYWNQQTNFKSDIYRQEIGADVSARVTDDDTYIGGFCVVRDSENNQCIIYTSQDVNENSDNPYGATALCFDDSTVRYKASVTDIGYDITDFKENSSNDFTFEITNDGTGDLHNLRLIVESDGKKVYSDVVIDELKFGNQKSVTLALTGVSSTSQLTAYIVAEESIDGDNSISSIIVEKAAGNISILQVGDNQFQVKNESNETAKNILIEIKNTQYGDIIRTVKIDSIGGGESKLLSLERSDWIKSNSIEGIDNGYSLYCQASYDDNEMELWDNSIIFETVDGDLTKEIDGAKEPDEADKSDTTENTSSPVPGKTPMPNTTQKPGSNNPANGGTSTPSSPSKKDDGEKKTNKVSKITKPSKAKIIALKNKKGKKIYVKYKKITGANGYQIQYSTSKKFKGKKSKVTTKTALTLSKLKKKKTYYLRVRAFKKVSGKKVYGKWSSVKKVKIKK